MIECPVCHRVSHHPVDVRTGWCSGCERFTGKTAEEVRAVAAEFGAAGDVGVAAAILYRLDTHGAASASGCGYSEETCLRCGWTMGQPALNCQNDDTPHRFPSQEALAAPRPRWWTRGMWLRASTRPRDEDHFVPAQPKWPLVLREAGFSDEAIVTFAITYPFSDIPRGYPYHEQGRQALARIVDTQCGASA